jgi:hypothetical protein
MIASSGATHSPETTALAYDGDPATRWTSGVPMEPTMTYWLTLDAPAMIAGISAQAADATDNPASWVVAVMDDDAGHGRQEVARGSGPIVATLAPVRGQVVRLECTSADPKWWWSIHSLTIDATAIVEEPPVVPPVVPPTEPPVTDIGWRTWSEELCRLVVEGMAAKHGWPIKQREVLDFTTGQVYVKQAVIWAIGKVGPDGERDYWPFEIN